MKYLTLKGVAMKDIKIREALESDLPRLLELEQNIVDSERPYDEFLKDLSLIHISEPTRPY